MDIHFSIPGGSRDKQYEELIPQVEALLGGEHDLIANLSNITAALKYGMNFLWTGFYFVKGRELVLGPFQGTPACTRIPFGKGVCGTAWKEEQTIIVNDVDAFPGHIRCSSETRSEIVVPVFKKEKVFLVLDIDSSKSSDFGETDAHYLEKISGIIEAKISPEDTSKYG